MQQEHEHNWYIIRSIELISQEEVLNLKQEEQPMTYHSNQILICCISCGEIKKLNDLK